MLDRFAALTHLFRMLVDPALNRFENVLVFPSRARRSPFAHGLAELGSMDGRNPRMPLCSRFHAVMMCQPYPRTPVGDVPAL
jgi:hypothetical protein